MLQGRTGSAFAGMTIGDARFFQSYEKPGLPCHPREGGDPVFLTKMFAEEGDAWMRKEVAEASHKLERNANSLDVLKKRCAKRKSGS